MDDVSDSSLRVYERREPLPWGTVRLRDFRERFQGIVLRVNLMGCFVFAVMLLGYLCMVFGEMHFHHVLRRSLKAFEFGELQRELKKLGGFSDGGAAPDEGGAEGMFQPDGAGAGAEKDKEEEEEEGGLGGIGSLKDLSDSETLHRGEAYLFHHGVGRNRSAAYLRTVADSNAWAEECKAPPTSMPHQP